MNQIFSTNDEKQNAMLGLKPVVRFFAIILIIVAIFFAAESGYKLYSSLKNQNDFPKAMLDIKRKNGSSVNINLTGEVPISKVEYSWNSGNVTVLSGNGRKIVNANIEIPQGENVLKISSTDVNGNKTVFNDYTVVFSEDDDGTKPVISIGKGETAGKLVIKVTDNKELDYITYNWEGEEPTKIEASGEDKTTIIQEVKVEKGTKKIYVTAVDKAGNSSEKELPIVGSSGAKINVSIENGGFKVVVTSESEITKILYTHNEKEQEVKDLPKGAKEYTFNVQLEDGINYLKIDAYEGDIVTEYKCKKTK